MFFLIFLLLIIILISAIYGSSENYMIVNLTLNKNLIVEIMAPKKAQFLGNIANHIILEKSDKYIKYIIKNKKIDADGASRYPFIIKNYCSAHFQNIIMHLNYNCAIKFKCNKNIYISSLGEYKGELLKERNYLIVITDKKFTIQNGSLFVYPSGNYFHIPKTKIINHYKKANSIFAKYFGPSKFNVFMLAYNCFLMKDDKNSGVGGTACYGGFDLHIEQTAKRSEKIIRTIKSTLRHELMHSWINSYIMKNNGDYTMSWFKEGFTEFFAQYLYYIKKPKKFQFFIDKYTKSYNENPYKHLEDDKLTKELFWNNYDAQALPYQRGFLIALAFLEKHGIKKFIKVMKELFKKKITTKDISIFK